ncbi:hypothetical protein DSL72_008986 [Monilinia vaccinii-corymbosi]|uniref:tRNA pseudouridine(55) synthase n=1 Tax=Monilinia vaccinii-corymbosi TaxID=61207 RepID=A0A8A3PQ08_9HELO|nr:hypothetical protein DSL72_008986 [Monilinia vaccinii-corymbosi]
MSRLAWWTMTKGRIMEGVFAINKPTGISSAQVVRDLQNYFNPSKLFKPWIESETKARNKEWHNQKQKRRKQKQVQVKIGHGGTLDPLATGVLIAGIGKGTKDLGNFLLCTKTYETIVLFGAATDTYDKDGKLLRRAPYEHITREMVEKGLAKYRGKFMQLPPLFSALKMNGKPLYEYAREGKEIPKEIQRREVNVSEMELLEWYEGDEHEWKAPTEEAGYAEVNVAAKLWKQENSEPAANGKEVENERALEDFESRKRKMGVDQDELVLERPVKKSKGGLEEENEDALMSGGLSSDKTSAEDQPIPSKEQIKKGPPAAKIRMSVSSGFYVRSLCHDLGADLGSAGLMSSLVRVRQGQFELGKNVLEYGELEKGEDVWGPKVEKFLDEWNEKGEALKDMDVETAAEPPVEETPNVKAEEKPEVKIESEELKLAELEKVKENVEVKEESGETEKEAENVQVKGEKADA